MCVGKASRTPTAVDRAQVMGVLPGIESHGTRSWKAFDVYLDLLGEVTTYTPENYTKMSTPLGMIVLQPVEDLLVERVFSARCWTAPNPTDEMCARKLMASVLRGPCDRGLGGSEACRVIASLSMLDVGGVDEARSKCGVGKAGIVITLPPCQTRPLPIQPDRCYTWEQWQAGRAERRRLGNLVAPSVIRRPESSSDKRLRAAFGGERGPPFRKAFDPELK